ncbi:MAG: hypothetical protein NTV87_17245 [Ignavibacteriae bacterium]|nr:hypothetical protein [Ignavibacteriota bacterium]
MHELVHVSQYEKLKRINGFLKQYFQEIKEYYNIYKNLDEAKKKIPLEKEAYKFVMNYKTHKNGGLSSLLNKDNILC